MGIGAIVEWTKSKLSQLASEGITVMNADSQVVLATGMVATPSLDLFESEQEYRVILDAFRADPQKVGKNEGSYELVLDAFETELLKRRKAA